MGRCFLHPSLTKLPGTQVDEHGNLKFKTEGESVGLRWRLETVLRLNPRELTGTRLSELLNWLRWGSQGGVMWECTLPELVALVEKWEAANPDAPAEQYGVDQPDQDWSELWKNARIAGLRRVRDCRCGLKLVEIGRCRCGRGYFDGKDRTEGPRGPETYNLVLIGGSGYNIAEAAFVTRGKPRPIPENVPVG